MLMASSSTASVYNRHPKHNTAQISWPISIIHVDHLHLRTYYHNYVQTTVWKTYQKHTNTHYFCQMPTAVGVQFSPLIAGLQKLM